MKFITNGILFIFLICQSFINADVHDIGPLHTKDVTLAQFLFESRDLIQRNPECVDDFLKTVNEINEKYKEEYDNCLNNAAAESKVVNDLTEEERNEIEGKAQQTCDRLAKCNEETLAIPFYKCHEEAGGKNIKELYTLSANAAVIGDDKNEQIRVIESNKNKCVKANQRNYDENIAKARIDLNNCLQGKDPEPTPPTEPKPPTESSGSIIPGSPK